MSSGKIVQIIGAVLDVEFPSDAIPNIYDALIVEGEGVNTTLEVQQQLGDGIVRTIALGSTDGLQRGLSVRNTGEAISIPVGTKTLGRIMNVLGEAIDEVGPIDTDERMVIHREAPKFTELSPSTELLETGVKVIDLIIPFAKGGKVGLFGGAVDLPLVSIPLKAITIQGAYTGNYNDMIALIDLAKRGVIKPIVSKHYSMDEANTALEDLKNRKVIGRSVINP